MDSPDLVPPRFMDVLAYDNLILAICRERKREGGEGMRTGPARAVPAPPVYTGVPGSAETAAGSGA